MAMSDVPAKCPICGDVMGYHVEAGGYVYRCPSHCRDKPFDPTLLPGWKLERYRDRHAAEMRQMAAERGRIGGE
jgi:hypothetical protein